MSLSLMRATARLILSGVSYIVIFFLSLNVANWSTFAGASPRFVSFVDVFIFSVA